MKLTKVVKDYISKIVLGKKSVPKGLFDIREYFRLYGPIHFDFHTHDGMIVAVSSNFRYGSIVTEGRTEQELDTKIKDAILTAFEVPSAYSSQAKVKKVAKEYALA